MYKSQIDNGKITSFELYEKSYTYISTILILGLTFRAITSSSAEQRFIPIKDRKRTLENGIFPVKTFLGWALSSSLVKSKNKHPYFYKNLKNGCLFLDLTQGGKRAKFNRFSGFWKKIHLLSPISTHTLLSARFL